MPSARFFFGGFGQLSRDESRSYFSKFGKLKNFFFKKDGKYGFFEFNRISKDQEGKLLGFHEFKGEKAEVQRAKDKVRLQYGVVLD